MDQFLLIALNGLTLAAVYFLVASGLTLIFGLMRVITMAHGTGYLLGGYVGYLVARESGNWFLGALCGALAVGLLGVIIHQVLIRRFQDDDMRVALITLGVALIGTDLMLALPFGSSATQVPIPQELQVPVPLPLVGEYPVIRILILGAAIVVGVALTLFINKTRVGSIVRAGVDDSQMTSATGVNVRVVFAAVFALGSALAGFAGSLYASQLTYIEPAQFGISLSVLAVTIVVLGGMRAPIGAFIGAAVLVAIPEVFRQFADWRLLFYGVLLLLLILFRPQGLWSRFAVVDRIIPKLRRKERSAS